MTILYAGPAARREGRGGDLRPLFESVEAAFYASSPGKHSLGVVNALVQGGNTPPMAGAVLYGRREDSAAIIFGESEGTARPQTRAWGQGRKKANGEEGKQRRSFQDQCSCCALDERRTSFQSIPRSSGRSSVSARAGPGMRARMSFSRIVSRSPPSSLSTALMILPSSGIFLMAARIRSGCVALSVPPVLI